MTTLGIMSSTEGRSLYVVCMERSPKTPRLDVLISGTREPSCEEAQKYIRREYPDLHAYEVISVHGINWDAIAKEITPTHVDYWPVFGPMEDDV